MNEVMLVHFLYEIDVVLVVALMRLGKGKSRSN